MSKAVRMILGLGLGTGVAYGAFRLLLTPQAQQNLVTTVRNAVATSRALLDRKDEEQAQQEAAKVAANRRWVQEQWSKLGY